jgi:hypothetical protein
VAETTVFDVEDETLPMTMLLGVCCKYSSKACVKFDGITKVQEKVLVCRKKIRFLLDLVGKPIHLLHQQS